MPRPLPIRSELLLLAAAVLALLLAALVADGFGSAGAWTLVAVLGAGYLLSRGAARGGVPHGAARARTVHRIVATPAQQRVHAPPEPPPAAASAPQAEVTLSEEQLRVDRREKPRERVRLVKHVVTEHVTITVPVRREEIRVERIPLDGAPPPADGEVVHELTLMEEEPVVDTEVVARERVVLAKDTVTSEEQVTEQLRHEAVDIEHERSDPRP